MGALQQQAAVLDAVSKLGQRAPGALEILDGNRDTGRGSSEIFPSLAPCVDNPTCDVRAVDEK